MAELIRREPIEWFEMWVEDADEEKLPRLLLIGDSITKSYYDRVSKGLAGKLSCAKLATSRCIGDPVLLDELSQLLKQYSFSIIQFNNGLHGMDNPDDLYRENFPKVIAHTRSLAPAAILIWATTTPWRCGGKDQGLHPNNNRVVLRNQIAHEFVEAQGIPINDLYKLLIGHPEYHSEDGVHLVDAGMQLAADKTVALIRKLLSEHQ